MLISLLSIFGKEFVVTSFGLKFVSVFLHECDEIVARSIKDLAHVNHLDANQLKGNLKKVDFKYSVRRLTLCANIKVITITE